MYIVYFDNTYIKAFTDEIQAENLANSLKIFNAEHKTDYEVKIVVE